MLIPKFGYEVAAYTTLISFMILFAATYWVCKFYTNLTIPRWTLFADYMLILLAAIAVSYLLGNLLTNIWLLVAIKLLIFSLIVIYVFYDKLMHILSVLKR